jgi:hypothetical protein
MAPAPSRWADGRVYWSGNGGIPSGSRSGARRSVGGSGVIFDARVGAGLAPSPARWYAPRAVLVPVTAFEAADVAMAAAPGQARAPGLLFRSRSDTP